MGCSPSSTFHKLPIDAKSLPSPSSQSINNVGIATPTSSPPTTVKAPASPSSPSSSIGNNKSITNSNLIPLICTGESIDEDMKESCKNALLSNITIKKEFDYYNIPKDSLIFNDLLMYHTTKFEYKKFECVCKDNEDADDIIILISGRLDNLSSYGNVVSSIIKGSVIGYDDENNENNDADNVDSINNKNKNIFPSTSTTTVIRKRKNTIIASIKSTCYKLKYSDYKKFLYCHKLIIETLSKSILFSILSTSEEKDQSLLHYIRLKKYPKDFIITKRDDNNYEEEEGEKESIKEKEKEFFIIISGQVILISDGESESNSSNNKSNNDSEDVNNTMAASAVNQNIIIGPGEYFGETAITKETFQSETAITLQESLFLSIPEMAFNTMASSPSPSFSHIVETIKKKKIGVKRQPSRQLAAKQQKYLDSFQVDYDISSSDDVSEIRCDGISMDDSTPIMLYPMTMIACVIPAKIITFNSF